jgi:hypothetical protein
MINEWEISNGDLEAVKDDMLHRRAITVASEMRHPDRTEEKQVQLAQK